MDAGAGSAVSEPDISVLILGEAGHPAISGIRSEGSLLIQGYGTSWVVKLIPADGYLGAVGDGVVHDRPIVIGEVPDGKAIHHTVAECIQGLSCGRLWNTAGRKRRLPASWGSKPDARRRRGPVDRCSADRKSTRLNSSHLGISYAVF